MEPSARRAELRAFLRDRRAAVTPAAAGLQRGARRLTPGLRREELAALAGVGLTWYTWLEQGREINVSADTLRRIARALRLSQGDEAYLFSLAGVPVPGFAPLATTPPPTVQLVLDGFTAGPAIVLGPTTNVLGFNRLAELVYTFDAYEGLFANNHLWRAFMDPIRKRLYVAWEESVRNFVALFRLHAAPYVGEAEYEQLVDALCTASPDFLRIWNERQTEPMRAYRLGLDHPRLGALHVHSVRLAVDGFAGMLFLLPPADAATAATFERMSPRKLARRNRPP